LKYNNSALEKFHMNVGKLANTRPVDHHSQIIISAVQ